jgi:hypothetical protein
MCERCGEVATVTSEAGRFCSRCDDINEEIEEARATPSNDTRKERIFYMIIGYGWVCFIPIENYTICTACGCSIRADGSCCC